MARRPRSRVGNMLGAFSLALLAVLSLYGGYAYRNSVALRKYLPALFAHGLHPKTPADVFPGQPAINLLVIGRDYDYTDKDQIIKSHARSDVLMVAPSRLYAQVGQPAFHPTRHARAHRRPRRYQNQCRT